MTRPAFPRLWRRAVTLLATLPVAGLMVWLFNLTSAALAPYQTWFQVALALGLGLWFLSHGLFSQARFARARAEGEISPLFAWLGPGGLRLFFLFDGALFLMWGTGSLFLHRLS
jgi:hypothetical protein